MSTPQFSVDENVLYFRRGICYPAIIREDLGILRGAGRRYRITPQQDDTLDYFVFDVAERYLVRDEEAVRAEKLLQEFRIEIQQGPGMA